MVAQPKQRGAGTRVDDEARRIRAALEQIDAYGRLRDFSGLPHEKRAIVAFAQARGLIAWRKIRHELTPAGRKWLIAHGGITRARPNTFSVRLVAALMVGGAISWAWFPADAVHQIFDHTWRATTAPVVSRHAAAEPDAILARTEIEPMKVRPSGYPLALIRSNAPVFSAASPAEGSEAHAPAAEEAAKTPAQETKKARRPVHRSASVPRQRYYEGGSAMAFSANDRPMRRSAEYPSWGFQYPGWNGWR
jgi:hypothetical protein